MKFPEQPVVFISKPFFIAFINELERPMITRDVEQNKLLIFLQELIFDKSTLYFDLEQSEIFKIIKYSNDDIEALIEPEEQLFLKYFILLAKRNGNIIGSCRSDLQIIKSLETQKFSLLKVIPTFLFLSEQEEYCKDIENEWGIISVSKSLLNVSNAVVDLMINNVTASSSVNIEKFFNEMPNCYSVVIEDPYLLKQEGNYLIDLIDNILSKKLTNKPLKITLITNYEGKDNVLKKIREKFSSKIELEHIKAKHIHDRNIYTNSYWLTSDYGFMKTYANPTKWVVFPLGSYYGKFYERLNFSLKGIKGELKIGNYITAT